MKKYFATLDIGTSSIKGIIWNVYGECLYCYQHSSPPLIINNLFVEQCLSEFKKRIIFVLEQLNAAISLMECHCLAISTQRNTMIVMDDHRELSALISWLDGRGKCMKDNRLNWFQEYFPDFDRINNVCSLMSWLMKKLTGNSLETASTAPQDWLNVQDLFSIQGPELISHGSIRNVYLQDNDFDHVIPKDLRILVGAGDKDCALLGGLALDSRAVLCTGTAFSLGKLIKRSDKNLHHDNIYYSPTQFLNYHPIETGLPYPGGLINYLQTHYQFDPVDIICELSAKESPLFCVPSIYSLQSKNMSTKPRYYGIEDAHPIQIITAGLEGIVLELMYCQSILNKTGVFFSEINLGGNNVWLRNHASWLADALQCTITLDKKTELTSYGLAMTALAFIHQTDNYFSSNIIKEPCTTIQPNLQYAHHWQYRFKQYCVERENTFIKVDDFAVLNSKLLETKQ